MGMNARQRQAQEQDGHGQDKADQRPGGAHGQHLAAVDGPALHQDKGAHGAQGRQRHGDKVGQRHRHLVVAPGKIVAQFVAGQNRHQAQGKGPADPEVGQGQSRISASLRLLGIWSEEAPTKRVARMVRTIEQGVDPQPRAALLGLHAGQGQHDVQVVLVVVAQHGGIVQVAQPGGDLGVGLLWRRLAVGHAGGSRRAGRARPASRRGRRTRRRRRVRSARRFAAGVFSGRQTLLVAF